MMLAYKREAVMEWGLSVGPPIHPDRDEPGGDGEKRPAVLGGFQCHVRGANYAGPLLIRLLENGTYAISAGPEDRESVPEKILGEVLDNLIMGKERARRGS